MKLYYDLHMHSCLSPCGDNDMTPNNLVNMALIKGLDVIALSDHNTALNCQAVKAVADRAAADGDELLVIPAIEVCTNEEVHLLCLFEDFDRCVAFGDLLYDLLPPIQNDPAIFGDQIIMNVQDEPVGRLDKLLINAANLGIDRLLNLLPDYGGFAIPAHVDRNSYSIIASLGFIPEDYHFSCIEVKKPPYDCGFTGTVITNSDAHYLEDIAERQHFLEVEEKSIEAVFGALKSAKD